MINKSFITASLLLSLCSCGGTDAQILLNFCSVCYIDSRDGNAFVSYRDTAMVDIPGEIDVPNKHFITKHQDDKLIRAMNRFEISSIVYTIDSLYVVSRNNNLCAIKYYRKTLSEYVFEEFRKKCSEG